MTTEHLHRPMPDAALAVGKAIEPELSALLTRAFNDVMAIEVLGARRHQDALSILFALAATAAAKAILLLGDLYPHATPDQIWLTGITDLQMQTMVDLQEFADRHGKGSAMQ